MKRSQSTHSPRASAGRITVRDARGATRTSAAPRCRASSARAAAAARSFSPSGVPPGSRVATTVWPRASMRAASQTMCVLLPAPSMPSSVMKRPLAAVMEEGMRRNAESNKRPRSGRRRSALPQLEFCHGAIVVGEVRGEFAGAVAPGDEIEIRRLRRIASPRRATPVPATRSASAAIHRAGTCCNGVSVSRSRLRRLPSNFAPSP